MNSKGISPLIATVLILGFTVALAAIIMTWGTSFTKKMQEQTEETADIQVICATDVIFDIDSACFSPTDNGYKILIKNNGNQGITGWKIRLYENANTVGSLDNPTDISAFGIGTIVALNGSASPVVKEIKQIDAIPIIQKASKEIVCSQNTDTYGDASAAEIGQC